MEWLQKNTALCIKISKINLLFKFISHPHGVLGVWNPLELHFVMDSFDNTMEPLKVKLMHFKNK